MEQSRHLSIGDLVFGLEEDVVLKIGAIVHVFEHSVQCSSNGCNDKAIIIWASPTIISVCCHCEFIAPISKLDKINRIPQKKCVQY